MKARRAMSMLLAHGLNCMQIFTWQKKDRFHSKAKDLIGSILDNNDMVLHERSQKLHSIIGGQMSVLPPDTRHVDYEIIPLNIAELAGEVAGGWGLEGLGVGPQQVNDIKRIIVAFDH